MRDRVEEIERHDLHLVVIGNGQPEHARAFREDERIPFPLWVDPKMEAYRAAGLRRGVTKTLGPRSLGHMVRALRGGHRQKAVQGDPWQLGGTFVITPQGDTVYQQISREAGDHASLDDVLRVLAAD